MIGNLQTSATPTQSRHFNDPDLLHVAIIMDGNGRWARARGLARTRGHRAGARRVQEVVEAASKRGVGTLTLYAFSADNWNRPTAEVQALMRLFRRYLCEESERCRANDIRLSIIGRRDRLPPELLDQIAAAERLTAGCTALHLRVALDYSSRDAIVRAAAASSDPGRFDESAFEAYLAAGAPGAIAAPDVDLLIRTGGEQRLSDFLLWECAYAELYFTATRWPDFDAAALRDALDSFARRHRRFGAVADSTRAQLGTS